MIQENVVDLNTNNIENNLFYASLNSGETLTITGLSNVNGNIVITNNGLNNQTGKEEFNIQKIEDPKAIYLIFRNYSSRRCDFTRK